MYMCLQVVETPITCKVRLTISFNIRNKSLYSSVTFLLMFKCAIQLLHLRDGYQVMGNKMKFLVGTIWSQNSSKPPQPAFHV